MVSSFALRRTCVLLPIAALFIAVPALAWTGPTQSPPNGNVAVPINSGSTGQTKTGDLGILGRVGAGTYTPNSGFQLDVYKSGWKAYFHGPDGGITIGPSNSGWAHIYSDNGASQPFIFNTTIWSIPGGFSSYSTADLTLQTNGTTRVTVKSSNGAVGINTTDPEGTLDVNGTLCIKGDCISAWPSTAAFTGAYVPTYATWNSSGTGGGGAAIYNDSGSYKSLMIVGNNSAGGNRVVHVWDDLVVNSSLTSPKYCIGSSCITSWPVAGINGSGTPGYIPRLTGGTTLGNSTLTDNGGSATAIGNFFVGGTLYDNDNTSYYVKPSGTSLVNTLSISSTNSSWAANISGGNYGLYTHTATGATNWTGYFVSGGNYGLYAANSSGTYGEIANSTWSFYGNKNSYVAGYARADGGYCIGGSCITSWPNGDLSGVTAGAGLTGGGTSGTVTLAADTTYMQRRVSGACAAGSSIRIINADGTVTCEADTTGLTAEADTLATVTARGASTPSAITIANPSAGSWASLNVGGSNSIQTQGSIYSYDSVCVGEGSGHCGNATGGTVMKATGIRFPDGTLQTTAASAGINGSGTPGYIPRLTGATTLGNSTISDNGGSATANGNFFVNGSTYLSGPLQIASGSTYDVWIQGGGSTRNLALLGANDSNGDALYLNYNNEYQGGTYINNGSGGGLYVDKSGNASLTNKLTTGALTVGGDMIASRTGLFGTYNSAQVQGIWSIGNGYRINTASNNFGTAYGLAYSYQPSSGQGIAAIGGHQIVVVSGGTPTAAIGISNGWTAFGRMYDTDNTGYYVDPASTTNLNTVYATAFLYSSDRRLKEHITLIPSALDKLSQLAGVSFTWRPGTEKAGQKDIGVIAQDVQKVAPEAVHTDDKGYLSVDYAKLVPLLINAVNEQQKEIDDLKTQVAALQASK